MAPAKLVSDTIFRKMVSDTNFWLAAVAALACSGPALGASALVDAAGDKDSATALELLAAGAAAGETSDDGTTALHWAAYHDDVALARALVDAGADPNAVNTYGSFPLAEAAATGNPEMIALLLEAGADVDQANADGQTALMVVARTNRVRAAELLLDAGAEVNRAETWRGQTALMWAAAQGQPAMIRLLLAHGAEPDVRSFANNFRQVSAESRRMYRPTGGLTPLLFAAREGCAECAAALIEGGADPDFANPNNVTPLVMALDNAHMDTARVLIEGGADVNKWDWWGRNPLWTAVDQHAIPAGGRADRRSPDATLPGEIIALLLERGANPDLQLKLSPPYRSIVDDRGCDSMLTTGMTPLLLAAKTFDVAAMQLLLDAGANYNLPNQDGVLPILAAAGMGSSSCDPRGYGPGIPHYETVDVQQASIAALKTLIDAGADVNSQSPIVTTPGSRGAGRRTGQTALHGAVGWGWNEVVTFLVEQGARIDLPDASGRTAFDAARGGGGGRGRGGGGGGGGELSETAVLLRDLCAARSDCDVDALIAADDALARPGRGGR